ncbi:MAG: methyltransferase domain-containing protein [Elusimicrobia bacterium]|nr:methyltransferase domain-containing protein [Elusimicrobiota bacterium]
MDLRKLKEALLLKWHGWVTRRKMNRVFSRRKDPFKYETSPYETARFNAIETALNGRRFRHALEVGCAEGVFTQKLASCAQRVTALDISGIALKRAGELLKGNSRVELIEGDIREWFNASNRRFDLIILGDILYYLDKSLVQPHLKETIGRLADWLDDGGLIILAHAFANPEELAKRRGFREKFERYGLTLASEKIVANNSGGVACLLSLLKSKQASKQGGTGALNEQLEAAVPKPRP